MTAGGGDRRLLGRWGETLVAEELRRRGWQVVACGYHSRFGEIDLIAVDKQYITFTEVKLRKNASFAPARAFVDAGKQRRIRMTAEIYLSRYPTPRQPRFDVAEVYAPQGMETRKPEIVILENVF